jgi:hypothetical protein
MQFSVLFSSTILTTEYLPPISSFWAAIHADTVWLEQHENYQKKSTRNRARILGANGIEELSVPLKKGKNSHMPIPEVQISYEDRWQEKHLHSIRSAYGNAPYFDYYFEDLQAILKSTPQSLLLLNQGLMNFIIRSLDLELNLRPTTEYIHSYGKDACDLRSFKFNDTIAESYIPKRYNQVFEEKHGFISGISILDLLMCKGPESILYI